MSLLFWRNFGHGFRYQSSKRLGKRFVCNMEEQEKQYHIPVMLQECLECLDVQFDKIYIDCTMGGGGHSLAILEKGGKVVGLDQDPDAIAESSWRLKSFIDQGRMEIIQTNFRNLIKVSQQSRLLNGSLADGILMDLGISSHQIDESTRGFSFAGNGPLDMRMHRGEVRDHSNHRDITAQEIVNTWNTEDLANLFYQYGEERRSRSIAREIVSRRPLVSTGDLENAISRITSFKDRPKVLARCFQALRIYVNDELGALEEALASAEQCLKIGGRIVILSYHSLEDRKVKNLFKTGVVSHQMNDLEESFEEEKDDDEEENSKRRQIGWKALTRRPMEPTKEEKRINRRSRSAKLRAAVRIDPSSESAMKYPKLGKKQLKKLEQGEEKI